MRLRFAPAKRKWPGSLAMATRNHHLILALLQGVVILNTTVTLTTSLVAGWFRMAPARRLPRRQHLS